MALRPLQEDASTHRTLECLLRRRLTLDDGTECGLLTPLDTSVNVLRHNGLGGDDGAAFPRTPPCGLALWAPPS